MFKILALVIQISTGEPTAMQSNQTFDTIEACEAVRVELVDRLKIELNARIEGGVEIASKCELQGKDA